MSSLRWESSLATLPVDLPDPRTVLSSQDVAPSVLFGGVP